MTEGQIEIAALDLLEENNMWVDHSLTQAMIKARKLVEEKYPKHIEEVLKVIKYELEQADYLGL